MRLHHRDSRGEVSETFGVTVNLCLGGMLVRVKQDLEAGSVSNYLIQFLEGSDAIQPDFRWGTVLRSRPAEAGFEVGVQFHSPLETLDVEALSGSG